jgi:predicted dienelactone hydrolase
MVFAYLVVIVLAVNALVTTNGKSFKAKTPTTLKWIATSLAVVLLGLSALLALALPVFTLPRPTGSYAVGVQYFHLVDKTRSDPFLDQITRPRELMVKVYYPAIDDASKPFSPYFHGSRELVRLFVTGYGMPKFMFDHLTLVKTNSKEGLRLSDQQPGYPVVLFSHGAGTTMEAHTAQSEDLASHGYIVVAIDHAYVSAGTVFPDHIVSHHEATTNFNTPEPAEIITQIMAEDAAFVIDQLGEINAGKIATIFKGKLNLDQIGAIGHSVGGAAAYNLAINHPKIKAAINLDGAVYITPKKDMAPFLMLANDQFHIQAIQNRENLMPELANVPDDQRAILISIYGSVEAYQQAYNQAQQNTLGLAGVLEASGNLYSIQGSDHMKFSDIGLFIGIRRLREVFGIAGKTDPARCIEITDAVTAAFFDQHLKGAAGGSLEALLQKVPELKKGEWR